METNTTKFRLFVAISVIWIIVVIVAVSDKAEHYWHFSDYAIPILLFSAPIILFWSSVWIWQDKFKKFFAVKSKIKMYKVKDENNNVLMSDGKEVIDFYDHKKYKKMAGKMIINKYRTIALEKKCAPSNKISDKKILEIYSKVGRAFNKAAKEKNEEIPFNKLNFIILKFLQVFEFSGEDLMIEHLNYEIDYYKNNGLRDDYNNEVKLTE